MDAKGARQQGRAHRRAARASRQPTRADAAVPERRPRVVRAAGGRTRDHRNDGDVHDVVARRRPRVERRRPLSDRLGECVLSPSAALTTNDVVSAWAGIRPLLANAGDSPGAATREHSIADEHERRHLDHRRQAHDVSRDGARRRGSRRCATAARRERRARQDDCRCRAATSRRSTI